MRAFFSCSDGQYYSDVQIWERLENDVWHVCCWDPEDGSEWVETNEGTLLHLVPVAEEQLPHTVTTESVDGGQIVVARSHS
ncbi:MULTISPECIES: hypothetical protein [Haloferax]|uniref:Uncharacterized protein n=1 Tax=Haloferax mediterranei (strain ATCC 33500 / DSM 1411 / JCM 8866 / NBRC 14739 / NCIMB 2177 / R-4) TaxID=523841 RepID=I3R786_HALMT|nr:hypothetical protein [Haloferax mediterranei]AFK20096.1 hypothetical protein HFX_2411 [Haloferax mediterranei ATCC 33500]MDX5987154.1 hypothetical protein [Haloferax mediterranei ATCC 33500]